MARDTGRRRGRPKKKLVKGVKSRGTLTHKQRAFVGEYLVDRNATQAAIRAGYSARTAGHIGPELLTKTRVADEVEARTARLLRCQGISAEEVISELRALALSDIGDVLDFEDGTLRMKPAEAITPEARRCLASVKVRRYVEKRGENADAVEVIEFKMHDKISALRELALHLPGFRAPSKVEITDPRAELARMLGVAVEDLPGGE